jgi:hypothetical protein
MVDTDKALISRLAKEAPARGTIFHYTSQEGLLGIIRNKSLWTSDIRYLNDSTEFAYAVELSRTKLGRKLRAERGPWNTYYGAVLDGLDAIKGIPLFVGSFSEQGDLLSQWRAYTSNGVGFSIGFDYHYLKTLAEKQHFRIVRCVYQESEHDALLEELINLAGSLVRDGEHEDAVIAFFIGLYTVAPALKHPSFSEEREWRLFSEIGEPQIPSDDMRIKMRVGRSMLLPYKEFGLARDDGRVSLSKVIVGPTPHMALSISSLKSFLLSSEVDGWQILPSTVPYRSW